MLYEDEFTEWLYNNYAIGNGDTLIRYFENPAFYETFLEETGRTDETA